MLFMLANTYHITIIIAKFRAIVISVCACRQILVHQACVYVCRYVEEEKSTLACECV